MFSLDVLSTQTLKAEARTLREERLLAGNPIGHGEALEEIARRHGYRDWNTASAALPDRIVTPANVGTRVRGTYLGQPFTGLLIGLQILPDMRHHKVTVQFDTPVNVSKFASMVHNRSRVTATVDSSGISPSHTSDGEPHMRLRRA